MKQILENCYVYFKTIDIEDDKPILEYLKEREKYRFILKQVTHEQFIELQNAKKFIDIDVKPVAALAPLKGNYFRGSGGLKVSDPNKKVNGTFIIEEERIIYDALQPFFEERDAYVYTSGSTYYTELDMVTLLKEELNQKRKFLIYMGQELNGVNFKDLFDEVDKDKFLEYAVKSNNGEMALARRKHY